MAEDVKWARRWMRRPGSSVQLNDFRPQKWHIQNPRLGASGTYCGVNVTRFSNERAVAPVECPPEGRVCAKCLRQHELAVVLPIGGGSSYRKG